MTRSYSTTWLIYFILSKQRKRKRIFSSLSLADFPYLCMHNQFDFSLNYLLQFLKYFPSMSVFHIFINLFLQCSLFEHQRDLNLLLNNSQKGNLGENLIPKLTVCFQLSCNFGHGLFLIMWSIITRLNCIQLQIIV